jgi:hypothetical protein
MRPARVTTLNEEVDRLEAWRRALQRRALQSSYAELEKEKSEVDSASKVVALESSFNIIKTEYW